MATITIIGPRGREERRLFRHNSLGRHPKNTHQVLDRVVSKVHCHIDFNEGVYRLRDLDSLNGTYVNGKRVGERVLESGDEITMGSTRIVFELDGTDADRAHTKPPEDAPGPQEQTKRVRMTLKPAMDPLFRAKLPTLDDLSFKPENAIIDEKLLRRDYEKLRASYEVTRAIGAEQDIESVLNKILEVAFRLVAADRGVILLYDDQGVLRPRAVRTSQGVDANQEVIVSKTVLEQALSNREAVISHDASADERFQSAQSVIMQGIRSTMGVPLIYGDQVFGIITLDTQVTTHAFTERDLRLFETVGSQAAVAIQNALYARKLEKEAVTRERFRRLLSPAIAEQVIAGEVALQKGGELRETTILFADIRGFTSMSASARPQDVVHMLNEYFELMVDIVFHHEGTLDKFIGDEIMALFGAPVAHRDDPARAVRAALDMQRSLDVFNSRRGAVRTEPIEIGVGINTGQVVAGYIGSSQALAYTVIGDPVNVGARLCGVAKPGQILISEGTARKLGAEFSLEELPPRKIKGKSAPMRLFQVQDASS